MQQLHRKIWEEAKERGKRERRIAMAIQYRKCKVSSQVKVHMASSADYGEQKDKLWKDKLQKAAWSIGKWLWGGLCTFPRLYSGPITC